jgi:hypothetical protein
MVVDGSFELPTSSMSTKRSTPELIDYTGNLVVPPQGGISVKLLAEDPATSAGRHFSYIQTVLATIIFLISAMALAGLSPLGQVLVQFIMVWQR